MDQGLETQEVGGFDLVPARLPVVELPQGVVESRVTGGGVRFPAFETDLEFFFLLPGEYPQGRKLFGVPVEGMSGVVPPIFSDFFGKESPLRPIEPLSVYTKGPVAVSISGFFDPVRISFTEGFEYFLSGQSSARFRLGLLLLSLSRQAGPGIFGTPDRVMGYGMSALDGDRQTRKKDQGPPYRPAYRILQKRLKMGKIEHPQAVYIHLFPKKSKELQAIIGLLPGFERVILWCNERDRSLPGRGKGLNLY